jgi:hypothetical protein
MELEHGRWDSKPPTFSIPSKDGKKTMNELIETTKSITPLLCAVGVLVAYAIDFYRRKR